MNGVVILITYLAAISLVAIAITIYDKYKAKRHGLRIPEKTLIGISALGGSAAMLITMLTIRHKTRKPKFMVGIPVIIALQLVLLYFILKGLVKY